MKVKSESEVAQSSPTLCDPMDCSLPGSSVHGTLQRQEYWSGLPLPSLNFWARKTYFGNMSINTVIEDLGMNEFPHDRSENEKRVKCSTKGRRHKYGRCRTKCGRG